MGTTSGKQGGGGDIGDPFAIFSEDAVGYLAQKYKDTEGDRHAFLQQVHQEHGGYNRALTAVAWDEMHRLAQAGRRDMLNGPELKKRASEEATRRAFGDRSAELRQAGVRVGQLSGQGYSSTWDTGNILAPVVGFKLRPDFTPGGPAVTRVTPAPPPYGGAGKARPANRAQQTGTGGPRGWTAQELAQLQKAAAGVGDLSYKEFRDWLGQLGYRDMLNGRTPERELRALHGAIFGGRRGSTELTTSQLAGVAHDVNAYAPEDLVAGALLTGEVASGLDLGAGRRIAGYDPKEVGALKTTSTLLMLPAELALGGGWERTALGALRKVPWVERLAVAGARTAAGMRATRAGRTTLRVGDTVLRAVGPSGGVTKQYALSNLRDRLTPEIKQAIVDSGYDKWLDAKVSPSDHPMANAILKQLPLAAWSVGTGKVTQNGDALKALFSGRGGQYVRDQMAPYVSPLASFRERPIETALTWCLDGVSAGLQLKGLGLEKGTARLFEEAVDFRDKGQWRKASEQFMAALDRTEAYQRLTPAEKARYTDIVRQAMKQRQRPPEYRQQANAVLQETAAAERGALAGQLEKLRGEISTLQQRVAAIQKAPRTQRSQHPTGELQRALKQLSGKQEELRRLAPQVIDAGVSRSISATGQRMAASPGGADAVTAATSSAANIINVYGSTASRPPKQTR
jgi:hypothetical protein